MNTRLSRLRSLLADARFEFAAPRQSRRAPVVAPAIDAPRILLLTSTLGSGHSAAATAIDCALRRHMPEADIRTLDFWSLVDAEVARRIRSAYLKLVQAHPELYDRLYRLDQRIWRSLLEGDSAPPPDLSAGFAFFVDACGDAVTGQVDGEHHATDRLLLRALCSTVPGRENGSAVSFAPLRMTLLKWSWAQLAQRLRKHLLAFAPDAIVAAQMNPAALLASVGRHMAMDVPVFAVPTDFGVHDFWHQNGIAVYCVANETIENLDVVAPARVAVTGIPLMPGFRTPPSVRRARTELKLDPHRPVLLIPGGGLGLGVDTVARRLRTGMPDVQLVALTGRNAAAHAALAPLAARDPSSLQVHEWTDRMELFMRAADIVVGKPGGLTVAEALACGRPLLATRTLRGQEGFNVRFLEKHDVGCLVADDELVPRIAALLGDRARLASIQRRAWALGRRDGAERIAELVAEAALQHALQPASAA